MDNYSPIKSQERDWGVGWDGGKCVEKIWKEIMAEFFSVCMKDKNAWMQDPASPKQYNQESHTNVCHNQNVTKQ